MPPPYPLTNRRQRTPAPRRALRQLALGAATVISISFSIASTVALAEAERGVSRQTEEIATTDPRAPLQKYRHLRPDSTIGDLLNHPAFVGFARLTLPWDDRSYDPLVPLTNIGSLLPYHSNVDPVAVVSALNRMIDDVGRGKTIFYEVYTEEQRREDPTLVAVGLFFVRGAPGAPFAVISPGGGFQYVASIHEGFPHAAAISEHRYNAFVLKYRAGMGSEVATQDLAAAISFILDHADQLGVTPHGYSLWGSSAGARMAATIGSHGVMSFGGKDHPKPSAVILAYTAHSDMSQDEPPTFVVVGGRDRISPPEAMENRIARLRATGTEVEYHRYEPLGHGFGLGTGTPAEGWVDLAMRFWKRVMSSGQ